MKTDLPGTGELGGRKEGAFLVAELVCAKVKGLTTEAEPQDRPLSSQSSALQGRRRERRSRLALTHSRAHRSFSVASEHH